MFTRITAVAVMMTAMTAPVMAQGRPDARAMTCAQVQDLIDQRGAAVLTTGQHTYDRFIARWNRCDHPFIPQDTRISTRDTNRCEVYICRDNPLDDFGSWGD